MATSQDPKEVVKRILRKNNVELKDVMKGNLSRIAGHFLAEELIEEATVNKMRTLGLDSFHLSAELLDACQPSLEQHPEEKFPKFIAALKKCVTMVQLAEKMEDEFKKASMSWPHFDIWHNFYV